MPRLLPWCAYLNSLRYFLVVIRAVYLKSIGVATLRPELAAMTLLGRRCWR
jgi:ABC-2 type transport system permease protein